MGSKVSTPANVNGESVKTEPPKATETTQSPPPPPTNPHFNPHNPHHAHLMKMGEIPSECPMHQAKGANTENSTKTQAAPSGCPIKHDEKSDINPNNMMPAPNQMPSPNQPFPLSTNRITSNIPKAGGAENEKWVYPSEQMFWNAMLRKGWRWDQDTIQKNDMSHIIKIHVRKN